MQTKNTSRYKRFLYCISLFALFVSAALPVSALAAAQVSGYDQSGSYVQQSDTASPHSGDLVAMGGSPSGQEQQTDRNGTVNGREAGAQGMLSGSFLGSLFFGYPYEGLGTVDIVALILIAMVLLNVFVLRRQKPAKDDDRFTTRPRDRDLTNTDVKDSKWWSSGKKEQEKFSWPQRTDAPDREDAAGRDLPPEAPEQQRRPVTMKDHAAAAWAYYSSEQNAEPEAPAQVAEGAHVPANFDVADFLEGARALYVRLQKAWGDREVDSLAPFVTESMLRILQDRAKADPTPAPVDVMLVNATLQNVDEKNGQQEASVFFSVIMRMDKEANPSEVDEVWRFVRGTGTGGMWRLSGIEAPKE